MIYRFISGITCFIEVGLYLNEKYTIQNILFALLNILLAIIKGIWYNSLQEVNMTTCYNKLWKLLIDKGLKKTDLLSLCGMSSASLAKLSKNENVTTDVLVRICEALDCNIDDIMEMK